MALGAWRDLRRGRFKIAQIPAKMPLNDKARVI
jgi:hypothetical protein